MKPVRLSRHARRQCVERGATEDEVLHAVEYGVRESAKAERFLCRENVQYDAEWQGKVYAIKSSCPRDR